MSCNQNCRQGRQCPASECSEPIGYLGEEPEPDEHGFSRIEVAVTVIFWVALTAVATYLAVRIP